MQYHNKLKLKDEMKLKNKTTNKKQNRTKKTPKNHKNDKKIKGINLIWEYNLKAIGMDSKTDYRRKDY